MWYFLNALNNIIHTQAHIHTLQAEIDLTWRLLLLGLYKAFTVVFDNATSMTYQTWKHMLFFSPSHSWTSWSCMGLCGPHIKNLYQGDYLLKLSSNGTVLCIWEMCRGIWVITIIEWILLVIREEGQKSW